MRRPSRLQTGLRDTPPFHVPTTPAESRRVAPASMGRSHRLQTHLSTWSNTAAYGRRIEEPYIQLLTKLHDQQRAKVHTGFKNNHIYLQQGGKQKTPA